MGADNIVPFPCRSFSIGPIDDASVSLNIYGADMDPEEVTQILGLSPTSSHRRGDRLTADGPPFRTGAWAYQVASDDAADAADLVLGRLLDRLPPDPALWTRLGQQYDLRIFFCIGFEGWNKGFSLSARNIQRSATLGVRMEFDLYAAENEPPALGEILNK